MVTKIANFSNNQPQGKCKLNEKCKKKLNWMGKKEKPLTNVRHWVVTTKSEGTQELGFSGVGPQELLFIVVDNENVLDVGSTKMV